MLALRPSDHDPLALALAAKRRTGSAGAAVATTLEGGDGWRVVDIVCTAGPHDRPFEEQQLATTISLVLAGTFAYRSDHGAALLAPGALLLGNRGHPFECSHHHGEGDRCLSFQFATEFFARLADDDGMPNVAFIRPALPPLRALAPLTTRARLALARNDSFEEIALELAATVMRMSRGERHEPAAPTLAERARVVRVLRAMEADPGVAHTLPALAAHARLSRYYFLRTFKRVTGVTPHQWLLRTRLRNAAARLALTREPVTAIALAAGFEDLSNFIRSFRAEFGVAPRRYRSSL